MNDDDGGHPRVLVSNRMSSDTPAPHEHALTGLARETLLAEGHEQVELSLSFVDDDEMARLHERYMQEAGPTDVLTFPLDDDDVDESGVRVLGDVVVCPAVAQRQAPDHAGSYDDEMALLVVHGVLHVLGHDHAEPEETAVMQARERDLLDRFHHRR